MDSEVTTPKDNGIRWWPAVVVLIMIASLGSSMVWHRSIKCQSKNIATAAIFLCSGVLWVLWWLVFSRIPLGASTWDFLLLLQGSGGGSQPADHRRSVWRSGACSWLEACFSRHRREDLSLDVDIELGPSVMATDASWAVESMSFEQFLGPERNTQIPITTMGMGFLDTPP